MSDYNYFPLHHHARNSIIDGMGHIQAHVARAAQLGFRALAQTDHGTMSGDAELYVECRKHGIEPLPGIEAYASYGPKTRKTFHLGLVAYTEQGYKNLVQINNRMGEDYYYKPILDLTRITDLSTEGVLLTTGCFFGIALSAGRKDETAALNVIATLAEYFEVYLEVQSHGIKDEEHDDEVDQRKVLSWAKTLGLPVAIGEDSHYILRKDRQHHDLMKQLTTWSDAPDMSTFPGTYGYHMMSMTEAKKHFLPEVWEAGMEGMGRILDKANVVIPPLDSFEPVIPAYHDADRVLRETTMAGLHDLPIEDKRRHMEQLEDELTVIEEFGFAPYMLLVNDIIGHMMEQETLWNTRGSAGSSLVCYLLGISEFDPLLWGRKYGGLDFDRFLSRDRAKLPDIDIDVGSTIRDEIISYMRQHFVVTSICNYGEMGTRNDGGVFRGSAVQKMHQYQRKTGQQEIVSPATFDRLEAMCGDGDILFQRGTHASGLVVAPDQKSMEWMPLAVNASGRGNDRWVTAFDMDSTEAMGYIKVDILGSATLDAVALCLAEIRVSTGEEIALPEIPLDEIGVYAMLSDGLTAGVFQLDGKAARRGIQRMRPKNIDDIIDAMALFRPATMDSGATDNFLRRRTRRAASQPVRVNPDNLHANIWQVIEPSEGVLLYQEQMLRVLKSVGLRSTDLTRALKVVKASNKKVIKAQREVDLLLAQIKDLASPKGWKTRDYNWLKTAFEAYANYGFNLAHATSYGLLAYRTAWLSYMYPGQFWQAMITAFEDDADKVKEHTQSLQERGFVKMPVDVNRSGSHIKVDVKGMRIYPALTSVLGIGQVQADKIDAMAPYEDMDEFVRKLLPSGVTGIKALASGTPPSECQGTVGHLFHAGAFRSIT